ncbi:hypothetical protein [Nocardia sp. NPDC003963]
MSTGSDINPAKAFFEDLRTWAYPQVDRHVTKEGFFQAVQEEAQRINSVGGYNRTPRQLDLAISNVTDWIWEKFVEGEPAEAPGVRDIRLQLADELYDVLESAAASTQETVPEYVTRVVLGHLAHLTLGNAELEAAMRSQLDSSEPADF